MMRVTRRLAGAGMALMLLGGIATPAAAQFSDSYDFLKAVKERNGEDATKLLAKPSFTGINTRDPSTGETALHIVVKRRDPTWLAFMLSKDADPNLRDSSGATPLLDAATIGWPEGERVLIDAGANVNTPNDTGETPLMRAAAGRDADSVRMLLAAGADPAAKDRMTGKTARDYAMQGGRGEVIARMIDAAKPAKAMIGPHL